VPTRVRKPRVLAKLRRRQFFSLGGLNAAIGELIDELNSRTMRRLGSCMSFSKPGPTGCELYRQIGHLGHECMVVAPALIPKRAGERVKTNQWHAITLARLHRAGELTAVRVPNAVYEAAADDLRRKTPASAFVPAGSQPDLQRDRHRTLAHRRWLAKQAFEHASQQIVFQAGIDAIEDAAQRLHRFGTTAGGHRAELVVVAAYQAMRGASFLVAVTFAAEIGDVRRFDS
jgi:transposase